MLMKTTSVHKYSLFRGFILARYLTQFFHLDTDLHGRYEQTVPVGAGHTGHTGPGELTTVRTPGGSTGARIYVAVWI